MAYCSTQYAHAVSLSADFTQSALMHYSHSCESALDASLVQTAPLPLKDNVQSKEGDFFYLDWTKMPLDSMMPQYSEVIPLESDYRDFDYRVRLLYPEWKEMSKEETLKMKKWADSLSYDINIHTFVGVSRGKGLLDVDFVPVVLRGGKYLKLMSAKMDIESVRKPFTLASTKSGARSSAKVKSSVERYTKQSKLSEGKWVKISIKEDGMYRLTRAALQKMGFKNPDNVHLYGHGGHRLSEVSAPDNEYDDLEEVALYQANKDTWLFWGNGLVYWDNNTRIFNPYATAAYYFLTEEDAPSKIETVDASNITGTPVKTFTDHVLYEKDEYSYAQFGRNLYENANFSSSGSRTYKLSVPSVAIKGDERLTIAFTAGASSATTLSPSVNGNTLETMSVSALEKYQYGAEVTKTYDVSKYENGSDWTIKLSSTLGNEAHLDYLALHYTRLISPAGKYVAFSGNSAKETTFCVSDADEWVALMRISSPGQQNCLLEGELSSGELTFTAPKGNDRFVCFNPNYNYPQPTVIGQIQNQNLHALEPLDMVIIVPESGKLLSQANRLAEAHRAIDGLRVAVVRADQVYNEFSSGTPDATAYRRLMKMLYDRAEGDAHQMPRYLLLMGDCAYDNRMLSSGWSKSDPRDYLLCFESENSFSDTRSYVMEDYFGLLDDGEGAKLTREKTDLGVGRFPVTTPEEAKIMVDKVIAFISNENAGAWKNVVMMLGDDGDNNSHMDYCNAVADSILKNNPELEVKKVMWDAYTRVSTLSANTYPEVNAIMHKQLEDGVMVMNYTGHGAYYVLSHEMVWGLSDFQNSRNTKLPLWFTAACDVMPFDGYKQNLGEEAVLIEGGGALAFVGTARTVYASSNAGINHFFSNYLFGKDDDGRRLRLGDALRMTKVSMVGTENSYYENKLQYALLGDPALVIGAPLNRVRMDSIIDVTTNKRVDVMRAGMSVKLSGSLLDQEGREMPDFNGIVTARIYDSMDTITCKRNDPSISDAFQFNDRSSVIFTGQDSVRNGKFEILCIVPKDIKYSNESGRVVLYAINDSLSVEANGFYEDFTVGGSVDILDTDGPEIELALNGELGGVVNSTPYLTARLSDESGINVTGIGIGHDILLTIDDNPEWTYTLNDYYVSDFGDYTQGSLSFVIPQLPGGKHTLSLRAWDLLNNTNVSYLDFTVDPTYAPNIINLVASPNPATTHTDFLITYDLPGSDIECTIEVFDYAGRLLWKWDGGGNTTTGAGKVTWNLSVGNGYGRISPGIYLYRASLKAGESKWVSKTQKLIVN